MATKTITTARSAKTGEYVKPAYAKAHPNTTVVETRKVSVQPAPKSSGTKK